LARGGIDVDAVTYARLAAAGVSLLGVGSLTMGVIYHSRLRDILAAPTRRLSELNTTLDTYESMYCRITGRVETDRYLTSPLSKKNVLLWRVRHWSTPFLSTKDVPTHIFFIDGDEKAILSTDNATLELDKSDYYSSIEHYMEAGCTLFVVGRVSKNEAGVLSVSATAEQKPYIISTKNEVETIQQMRQLEYTFFAVGAILIAGALTRTVFVGENSLFQKWLEGMVTAIHPV